MSTVYIWTPDLPSGYGAFDQDDRTDEVDICEKCGEELSECYCKFKESPIKTTTDGKE